MNVGHLVVCTRSLPMHHIGGMEAVVWDLARQFAKDGMRVTVLTTHLAGRPEVFEEEGVTIVALDVPAARYSRAWWRKSRRYFEKNLMQSATCVLSVSAGAYGLLPLKPRMPGVPFIFQAHGTSLGEIASKWQTRDPRAILSSVKNMVWFFRELRVQPSFDAIVAVGKNAYDEILSFPMNTAVSGKKVHRICNGIDSAVFGPDEESRARMRRQLGWDCSEQVIVSASRLHKQKGVHLGLQAFADYARQNVHARYLIVGDGPERKNLEMIAETLGVADKVCFAGEVSRECMPDYLRCGDVFLFTTLRQEGLPLNVLEALAVGMPVVLSQHICALIDVEQGMAGVNPQDGRAVAQTLAGVLYQGRCGGSLLPDEYSLTYATQQYVNLMTELASVQAVKPMILQVGRDMCGTGGGRVVVETSLAMNQAGFDVVLVTDSPVPELGERIPVVTVPWGRCLHDWQPRTRLERIVRHTLQLVNFMLWGTLISSLYRDRIVVNHNLEMLCGDVLVMHNVFNSEFLKDQRPLWRKSLRLLNPVFIIRLVRERMMLRRKNSAVVGVSQVTVDEARPYVAEKTCMRAINNGVDVDYFRPPDAGERDQCRRDKGAADDDFILLFVGHEFERKGLRYIIEALGMLPPEAHLWVVGGRGSTLATYQLMAERLQVSDRVHFWGSQTQTRPFYWGADVYVMPTAYEAWPLVGLEAMGCGVPAFMSDAGGIKEFLKDGVNGRIILRDVRDISAKILSAIASREGWKNMSDNARETALMFGWDMVARQYLDLICDVDEKKRRRH